MSIGYTGLIIDQKAILGMFNKVKIVSLETYETNTTLTSKWHETMTVKFNSKFKALLFIARLKKEQYNRLRIMLKNNIK